MTTILQIVLGALINVQHVTNFQHNVLVVMEITEQLGVLIIHACKIIINKNIVVNQDILIIILQIALRAPINVIIV